MRTVAEHRKFLEQLASKIDNPKAGFFGPRSTAWRVNRELGMSLVVIRALMLQIAHPKVAQGVAEHSDFTHKPFGRAYATFKAQQTIVFGSCEDAIEALMRIYSRHVSVRGGEGEGQYQANDPDLLFWVYATLIDSMFYAYRTFLPPLSAADLARFYEEGKLFAALIGIPEPQVPRRLVDFELWMGEMLAGETIAVSPQGKQIGRSLMEIPIRQFKPLTAFLAAGTLPPRLRREFGLRWSPRRQRLFDFSARVVRLVTSITPRVLHTSPVYWVALRRAKSTSRLA